ncbi:MAG: hypothetical protein COU35_04340 [Candidatus Magasanikbacteria bacterium CG10_big_fil_rev_8_21_14_0_10_47_10]|uniref:TspO protein n=1 Tax=Candidatus Magasanikbacteria bacterium CG10_big_fil_rev_8_21_14_0_10_47_10 TaxID=1974652 RepID=A0A2H0TPF4_9BACT|nr:MAG: hypothetical protein COU35_04340 [Candidatus Magasanikbacteria bacterium CG10_big_fil_rev_8_21_14_0_10_47_10]
MKIRHPFALIGALALPQLAGIIGSIATAPAIDYWYASLNKPALNPPNWIFGPAWFFLFILMGIAWYLILQKGWHRERVRSASFLFLIQLAVNSLWSIVFFGFKSPGFALIVIIFFLPLIGFTTITFDRVDKRAAALLLPYMAWVAFATYLNAVIWLIN